MAFKVPIVQAQRQLPGQLGTPRTSPENYGADIGRGLEDVSTALAQRQEDRENQRIRIDAAKYNSELGDRDREARTEFGKLPSTDILTSANKLYETELESITQSDIDQKIKAKRIEVALSRRESTLNWAVDTTQRKEKEEVNAGISNAISEGQKQAIAAPGDINSLYKTIISTQEYVSGIKNITDEATEIASNQAVADKIIESSIDNMLVEDAAAGISFFESNKDSFKEDMTADSYTSLAIKIDKQKDALEKKKAKLGEYQKFVASSYEDFTLANAENGNDVDFTNAIEEYSVMVKGDADKVAIFSTKLKEAARIGILVDQMSRATASESKAFINSISSKDAETGDKLQEKQNSLRAEFKEDPAMYAVKHYNINLDDPLAPQQIYSAMQSHSTGREEISIFPKEQIEEFANKIDEQTPTKIIDLFEQKKNELDGVMLNPETGLTAWDSFLVGASSSKKWDKTYSVLADDFPRPDKLKLASMLQTKAENGMTEVANLAGGTSDFNTIKSDAVDKMQEYKSAVIAGIPTEQHYNHVSKYVDAVTMLAASYVASGEQDASSAVKAAYGSIFSDVEISITPNAKLILPSGVDEGDAIMVGSFGKEELFKKVREGTWTLEGQEDLEAQEPDSEIRKMIMRDKIGNGYWVTTPDGLKMQLLDVDGNPVKIKHDDKSIPLTKRFKTISAELDRLRTIDFRTPGEIGF